MRADLLAGADRNDVQMVVEYRLAGGGAIELANPHAIGLQGRLNRSGKAPAGNRNRDKAGLIDIQQARKMRFDDDQSMTFTGRIDIHKAQGRIIFVNLVTRNPTLDDFAKDAVIILLHGLLSIFIQHRCVLGKGHNQTSAPT